MTPDAITRLFKEAANSFPPLEGKPTNDDHLAIQECLLPLLMVISYDQLNLIHSLTAILTDAAKYKALRMWTAYQCAQNTLYMSNM